MPSGGNGVTDVSAVPVHNVYNFFLTLPSLFSSPSVASDDDTSDGTFVHQRFLSRRWNLDDTDE